MTYHDVERLRAEAGAAGDAEQVAICDRALRGEDAAWAICEQVITEARKQSDEAGHE